MNDEPAKIELDYAPLSPVLRRRWVRALIVLLVIASMLGGAWWRYRYRLPYIRRAYAQWRCRRFSAAKDVVAYEEDEARVAALAGRSDYLIVPQIGNTMTRPAITVAGYTVTPLTAITGRRRMAAFVGSLTAADGKEWCVWIELNTALITTEGERRFQIEPWVMPTLPLDGSAPKSFFRPGLTKIKNFHLARIYRLHLDWAQHDPQHADRLTLRYNINNIPGLLEGRIDNSGAFTLRVVDGPLQNLQE